MRRIGIEQQTNTLSTLLSHGALMMPLSDSESRMFDLPGGRKKACLGYCKKMDHCGSIKPESRGVGYSRGSIKQSRARGEDVLNMLMQQSLRVQNTYFVHNRYETYYTRMVNFHLCTIYSQLRNHSTNESATAIADRQRGRKRSQSSEDNNNDN